MNLALWLERQAQQSPNRPALFLGRDCVADYGAFWSEAVGVARWLMAQDIKPGDRVAIYMKNAPEYLTCLFGAWAAGAVAVPINAKLHGKEAAFVVKESGARVAFVSTALEQPLRENATGALLTSVPALGGFQNTTTGAKGLPVARTGDDLAWLFYTSGTTGAPKGVMITHGMLMSMSLCYGADVDPVLAEDATLYAAPMSHGAGLYSMMHVRAGARHVCPPSGGFDPAEVLDLAAHFGSTQLFAAPTMVKRLTQHAKAAGRQGGGLRTIVYAGGPMYNADIIDAVDHFGPVFVQIYGQGECPMGITALARADVAERQAEGWAERLQSVGCAQSAVEVAIMAPDGTVAGPDTQGEIIVRGATVMPGYWNNDRATASTLVNGWLMTGDIGSIDARGYVTLQDRSKDMIISGGSNIYPREVEEVLLRAPGVEEVSVVGRPHPEWGEEVVAFVVGDFDPVELDQMCLAHIARFKRPKQYIPLAELPKNNYGKVLKTELRARLIKQQDGF